MKSACMMVFAVAAYSAGAVSLLLVAGFLLGIELPAGLARGTLPPGPAVLVDLCAAAAFFTLHSVMARRPFKAWWTRRVPPALERTVYVLTAGITTITLLAAWQPIPVSVWEAGGPWTIVPIALALTGWTIMVAATVQLGHGAFFGLEAPLARLMGRPVRALAFQQRRLYALVRHPISLGWLLVVWSTPEMTADRLLFAVITTVYILVVTPIEEHDLEAELGATYRRYRSRVPALVPRPEPTATAPSVESKADNMPD